MATVDNQIPRVSSVFNGPVEFGIRSALILVTAYPVALDLNRLLVLDYVIGHSGDIAPGPMRAGEISIRRGLVEKGLQLLASRGLVKRVFDPSGIYYQAEDLTNLYISALRGDYLKELKERVEWAIALTEHMSSEELSRLLKESSAVWRNEFIDLVEPKDSAQ
jgi:hypothetical protein